MKIRLFYHSLLSDWNHGNAHFLRGIVAELLARGHDVLVYEPKDSWSLANLLAEHGRGPLRKFRETYPGLKSVRYDPSRFSAARAVAGADLVIVHEWSPPHVVQQLGELRRHREFVLLFHDTHHRLVTDRDAMRAFDLSHYDGVLAYGEVLRRLYLSEGMARQAWTWHEAADPRVFHPISGAKPAGDLVWVGNWGDDERTEELMEFLIRPVKMLGLKARVYGVRYPEHARAALADAGIEYGGWLPNLEAPKIFAQFKVTVHVPRRPYVKALPGIPTIRPFEALACGIPLVCSPWRDAEHLFTPGEDFSRRAQRRTDDAPLADAARKSVAPPTSHPPRTRHHPRASHLRASRGRAARDPCQPRGGASPHRRAGNASLPPSSCRRRTSRGRLSSFPHVPSSQHRVLRLESRVGVLERRRHLLPRHRARSGGARTPRDVLRT
ncbi:MAG: glycosyltransferase [Opitutus sp.]|nr:glycosyltransferase [Opitutus sp.]